MREPIVCTMRQPPIKRAEPHRGVAGEHDPERHVELAAEIALRVEQHRDDAHGLLRVVAAVAERIERRRHELQRAEGLVDRKGRVAHEQPRHDQEQQSSARIEARQRREHDRGAGLGEAAPDDRRDARPWRCRRRPGRRSARASCDDGMPSAQVMRFQLIAPISAPNTTRGSTMSAETMPVPIVCATCDAEDQEGDEIEERRPQRPRVCGRSTRVDTMVAIEFAASCRPLRKSNDERDEDQRDQKRQCQRKRRSQSSRARKRLAQRRHHTFSSTMPWISLATSSKRSTTFSRWS